MTSLTRDRKPAGGAREQLQGLAQSFVAGPAAIPALVVVVVMVVWTATEAGQPPMHWYPGALVILGLLVLAATSLPLRLSEVPRPVLAAAGLLLAFTLFSFLSIAWADAKGTAWDGANRTLLYLVVFVLFALWRQRPGAATAVIVAWILAVSVLAAITLVKIGGPTGIDLFSGARLKEPAGYANATAAMFVMPAWPAVILAGRRELGWALRALLAGAAVLLGGVSLVALSRGSVFSVPVMLVLIFVAFPGRARTFVAMLPVAGALAIVTPVVLEANEQLPKIDAPALDPVAPTIALCALGAVAVTALGAVLEGRVGKPSARRSARRAIGAVGLAVGVAGVVAGLAIGGGPVSIAEQGWDSFKQGYSSAPGQRLGQGLGSNRYDFYRVSLDVFTDHPIAGTGADNFQQDYLARRNTGEETPRYPHSLEMRTLSQTGVVGTLLLVGFLLAAALAAAAAVRRASPLGKATAAAGVTVFAYWVIHGSFDWFWEFAGLGVPAFAMLGLACGLAPRRPVSAPGEVPSMIPRVVVLAALVVAVASMALPWLSDVSTQYAADHWRSDPKAAYDRLDRAASLDPLSPEPYLAAGTIALKRSEQARARSSFRKALERQPRSAYATLELGALASSYGDRQEAERLLERTVKLDPRDTLARKALADVRAGRQVSIEALNAAILGRVRAVERGG